MCTFKTGFTIGDRASVCGESGVVVAGCLIMTECSRGVASVDIERKIFLSWLRNQFG